MSEGNVTNLNDKRGIQNGGSGGNGGDVRERLATLETEVRHLATKEGLQEVITQLEAVKGELGIIKWIMGVAATAAVAIAINMFVN